MRNRRLPLIASLLALTLAVACGKKAEEPAADKAAGKTANKAGASEKAGQEDDDEKGEASAKKGEDPAEKPAAEAAPAMAESVDKRFAARLTAMGIEHTMRDDTAKRAKVFDAEVQPAIAALHKFKFGKASVQLSLVTLSDATKKRAVAANLNKLFGQLKAAKSTYKRSYTSRSENATTAALLVFEPADEALAKNVSKHLRIVTLCGAATAHNGDRTKMAEMVLAAMIEVGAKATSKAYDDVTGLGAASATVLADDAGNSVLVATYADVAVAGRWAIEKEERWQKILGTNPKLSNLQVAGLENETTKLLVTYEPNEAGNKISGALNNLDLCLQKMAAK